MHKLLTAALLIAALACDTSPTSEDGADLRLWTPEAINIEAHADGPLTLAGVLECLAADAHPVTITYGAGLIDADDRKPIALVLDTSGHEDADLCVRQLLVGKLGGEVVGP